MMTRMKIYFYLCCLLLVCPNVWALELERLVGYAYEKKTGELLYVERHQRWFDGGRIRHQAVQYENAQGEVFARKTLNYQDSQLRPEFALVDQRSGHIETLRRESDGYLLGSVKGRGKTWRERTMLDDDFIADAGFDRLIDERWGDLTGGQVVDLPFLLPVALKTVQFSLRQIAESEQAVTFRMSPRTWLLRMLVAPIDVSYDKANRRLLRYDGLSNLHNQRLKNFKVTIEFPPAEQSRQAVTELASLTVPPFGELRDRASGQTATCTATFC